MSRQAIPDQKPGTLYAAVRPDGTIAATMPISSALKPYERDEGCLIAEVVSDEIPDGAVSTREWTDVFDAGAGVVRRTFQTRSLSKQELIANVEAERRAAYPAIGDQLDDLWKAVGAIIDNERVPDEARDRLAEIRAVKAAFPKPVD